MPRARISLRIYSTPFEGAGVMPEPFPQTALDPPCCPPRTTRSRPPPASPCPEKTAPARSCTISPLPRHEGFKRAREHGGDRRRGLARPEPKEFHAYSEGFTGCKLHAIYASRHPGGGAECRSNRPTRRVARNSPS